MGPTLAIRRVAGLTVAERERLLKWGPDIFGGKAAGLGHLKYRRKPLIWVAYDGCDPVSRVCGVTWTPRINGQPMLALGLGGIVTVPDHQRQGIAQALIDEALEFGSRSRVDVALLLCLPHRLGYYQGLGWDPITVPSAVQQEPEQEIANPFHLLMYPIARDPRPIQSVNLESQPW